LIRLLLLLLIGGGLVGNGGGLLGDIAFDRRRQRGTPLVFSRRRLRNRRSVIGQLESRRELTLVRVAGRFRRSDFLLGKGFRRSSAFSGEIGDGRRRRRVGQS
jgi:hypothetical protein